MNHHYFRADIEEWEITTVVTVKTLAFDVKTPEVRIIDEAYLLYKQPSGADLGLFIRFIRFTGGVFPRKILKSRNPEMRFLALKVRFSKMPKVMKYIKRAIS